MIDEVEHHLRTFEFIEADRIKFAFHTDTCRLYDEIGILGDLLGSSIIEVGIRKAILSRQIAAGAVGPVDDEHACTFAEKGKDDRFCGSTGADDRSPTAGNILLAHKFYKAALETVGVGIVAGPGRIPPHDRIAGADVLDISRMKG